MYTITRNTFVSYVKGQLGLETPALGAKWKSQLYAFPPVISEHSLEFSALEVQMKESSSSGGRDESHLNSASNGMSFGQADLNF